MFDKVLKPNVTQSQVYEAAAKSIVKGQLKQSVSMIKFPPTHPAVEGNHKSLRKKNYLGWGTKNENKGRERGRKS